LHISRKERGRGRNAELSPRSENRGLCGLARERGGGGEGQVWVCIFTLKRIMGVGGVGGGGGAAAGGGVYMYGD
jgi:hypothetical protein